MKFLKPESFNIDNVRVYLQNTIQATFVLDVIYNLTMRRWYGKEALASGNDYYNQQARILRNCFLITAPTVSLIMLIQMKRNQFIANQQASRAEVVEHFSSSSDEFSGNDLEDMEDDDSDTLSTCSRDS